MLNSDSRSVTAIITIASALASALLLAVPQPSAALSGQLDTHFGTNGSADLPMNYPFLPERDQIAAAADGSFAVVGSVGQPWSNSFGGSRWTISRFTRNGKPDPGFGRDGRVVLRLSGEDSNYPRSSTATAVMFDARGRLLVAGSIDHATMADYREASKGENMQLGWGDVQNDYLGVIRLKRNGGLDHSFGRRGEAQVHLYSGSGGYGPNNVRAVGLGQLPSGRVVVGATNARPGEYRSLEAFAFSADGRRIKSFGANGRRHVSDATSLRVGPGARIFTGGISFTGPNAADLRQTWVVTKLRSDGRLDRRYGHSGVAEVPTKENTANSFAVPLVDTTSIDIAPIRSGRVLITAAVPHGTHGHSELAVARLGAGGRLDKSYGTAGFSYGGFGADTSSSGSSIVVNASGEIFAGGTINTPPFNDPNTLGGLPFSQGVIVAFDSRGRLKHDWASIGAQQLTPAGVASCPSGPQLAPQAKRVLVNGCSRVNSWFEDAEVFRLKP